MKDVSIASSVTFVRQLDRSVAFYRDVFSCTVAIRNRDAALLIAPGGFQMYLISRGDRAQHALGGIGLQHLTWVTDSAEALEQVNQTLQERGSHTDTYTSGGVTFVEGRDPDGICVVIAYPSPQTMPRTELGSRLYH
jgi:catechol-2,3-dioxygenase